MKIKTDIKTPAYQAIYREYETLVSSKGYVAGGGMMYTSSVHEFLVRMEEIGITSISNANKPLVLIGYYEYLSQRPNMTRGGTLSSATISQHLFAIALLFDYLLEKGTIKSASLFPKFIMDTTKPRDILSVEEIKLLYHACENKIERALLAAAYGCGLRRSEIKDLNLMDVQLCSSQLIVRTGKGKKRRVIPLSNAVVKDFRDYILYERDTLLKNNRTEEAFFISKWQRRMSGHTLLSRLHDILKRTTDQGILEKKLSLHSLRHSIATHLIDNGASLEFVRDFLGHTVIDTSQIYVIKRKRKQQFSLK